MANPKYRKEIVGTIVRLIEEHRFTDLAQLVSNQDLPLPETAIRMGYRLFLEKESSFKTQYFLIKKLREITQIEPDETIVRDLLNKMMGFQPLTIAKIVLSDLNITPKHLQSHKREIQTWYRNLIDSNQFIQISELKSLTGIPPDPEMVQEAYKAHLSAGRFISYTGLSKQLAVSPLPATIASVYCHYRQALGPGSTLSPSDREQVQKWYQRLPELTGVKDPTPLDNTGHSL